MSLWPAVKQLNPANEFAIMHCAEKIDAIDRNKPDSAAAELVRQAQAFERDLDVRNAVRCYEVQLLHLVMRHIVPRII